MRIIKHISLYFVSAILLFAGIDKLLHIHNFTHTLEQNILLSGNIYQYIALPIIITEVFIGISILYNKWRLNALIAALILFLVFLTSVVVNYFINPESSCGCWFSIGTTTVSLTHIFQNIFILGLITMLSIDSLQKNNISIEYRK